MPPDAQRGSTPADAPAAGVDRALAGFALVLAATAVVGADIVGVLSADPAAGLPYAADGSAPAARAEAMDERVAATMAADGPGPLPANIHASNANKASPPPRMKKRRRQYAVGSAGLFRLRL